MTPTNQAAVFEILVQQKLDLFCPEKSMKVSSQDKAWINFELKSLKRQKSREYEKRGKTDKYKNLEKMFKSKNKIEAGKYLRKNMDDLKQTKPGQAYSILKKMGAQPGDCINSNTCTLPAHES